MGVDPAYHAIPGFDSAIVASFQVDDVRQDERVADRVLQDLEHFVGRNSSFLRESYIRLGRVRALDDLVRVLAVEVN